MITPTVLDPNRSAKAATGFEIALRHQFVGEDEAIEQIVRVHQIHCKGPSPQ
jgi:hypothetical protein